MLCLAIRKMLIAFFIMMGSGLLISYSAHADEQADASDSLIKISLPNIALLEPWIEKSKEERAKALPNYEEVKAEVRKAYINAYASKDFVFMAASSLSGALTYWMKDDDAGVCSMLVESADYLSQTSASSAMFLVVVKTAKVEEIYARLYAAAGCANKDKPYWSRKVVSSFNTMMTYLTPGPDNTLDNTALATQEHFGTCLNSDKLAGDTSNGQSIVSDASIRGCYAISLLAKNDISGACDLLFEASAFINQNNTLVVTDPDELKAQKNIDQMIDDLHCRDRLIQAEMQKKIEGWEAEEIANRPVRSHDDEVMDDARQWMDNGRTLYERAQLYSNGGDSEGACQSYYEAEKAFKNAADAYGKVGDKFRASHNKQAAITSKDNSIADGKVECEAAGLKMYWIY